MINCGQYRFSIYVQNSELKLDDGYFQSFVIYEILSYGFPIFELTLDAEVVRYFKTVGGGQYEIVIEDSTDTVRKTFKVLLYSFHSLSGGQYIITFIPQLIANMDKHRSIKGYYGRISDILGQICNDKDIKDLLGTKDIENSRDAKLHYFKYEQSYIEFIRELSDHAKDETANFMFFFDKFNNFSFNSMKKALNSKVVASYVDSVMLKLNISDRSYALQSYGGLGGLGVYFDWDSGSFKKLQLFQFSNADANGNISYPGIGISKELATVDNNTMLLLPTAKNMLADESINKALLENRVMRQNMFNIFLSFTTLGNIEITAGQKINCSFADLQKGQDDILTADYIIFAVNHIFTKDGYSNFIECARPFWNVINSTKYF